MSEINTDIDKWINALDGLNQSFIRYAEYVPRNNQERKDQFNDLCHLSNHFRWHAEDIKKLNIGTSEFKMAQSSMQDTLKRCLEKLKRTEHLSDGHLLAAKLNVLIIN